MIALLIAVRSDRRHVLLDHLVLHLAQVVSELALEVVLDVVPYVEIVAGSFLVQVFTGGGGEAGNEGERRRDLEVTNE